MLLSIVMMVKNEEKYLDKTLNALIPLMKDINSELIILDTGSIDSSIDIAKKYTDKVYFDNWTNDFSEMRNKSISYAKGDWILILDADEELINYDKLKQFFTSKLHKKYNSASIELKNILSEDEKGYSMAPILRLFRNYEGFKYEGAIHEQPLYQKPIYNSIALFKHYGYLFVNEEIRQLKDKRNKSILMKEVKLQPNNPYMNYQLGKSYNISGSYEDATFYMEKGYNLYSKIGHIPIFVTLDLANLYMELNEFNKCEKLCLKYIKKDNKNIDIYYYLATSQKCLGRYKQSLENYKRYLYLLDNYDISTQANDMECNGDTVAYREQCEVNILDNYYKLEMYDEIVNNIDKITEDVLSKAYLVIFMALYKKGKEKKILELYKKCSKSIVERKKLKENIEITLKRVKEEDKIKMYKILSDMEGNYGNLNKIRLGEKLTAKEYNDILVNENEVYYGDIIYYALNQNLNLESILKQVSYIKLKNYIDFIIANRRDSILDLYNFLKTRKNTLDINKINIYSCLSKILLMHGNLVGDKYEDLFLMHMYYTYESLKKSYDRSLSDEDLLNIIRNNDDEFIVKINIIQKNKEIDEINYIKEMKKILIDNPEYKKGIELVINKFENELKEGCELKQLKKQYKSIIEKSINNGMLEDAFSMIKEYELMYKEDYELINMKSILCLLNGNFDESECLFKKSLMLKSNNFNTVFNIAYLKEISGEIEESIRFYSEIVNYCQDEDIVMESKEKINLIKCNSDGERGA